MNSLVKFLIGYVVIGVLILFATPAIVGLTTFNLNGIYGRELETVVNVTLMVELVFTVAMAFLISTEWGSRR
ncbi:hypothetical protein CR3_gp234 [Cronobacter phage CR3]|uniref:Uncharacterized protein n=1 Tax=Cronobacter phage CR3 TaxID=1162295 RepID=I1TRS6_9CAUD|nr:hypothetical protein CR3_gp234 [Cronobacter phage CR3]AFH21399.1 hypothetical protein CR3_234 [Cronobacter phage CR3]ATS93631.1 hypothetical protein P1A145kb_p231 [Pectobacterium phage DU_PP_I]ATS93948.1 hypothetical protein P12B145kb_p232 [Pectobacterium phage DU_PP_IV]